ncbi:HTH domain-containing protein [Streptomyces odontomachi]|uniref:HTH domain-containing protein n=1 Tax=Streptomyces odontomachi TaxID=2944940 RepID=UPI00210D2B10|nr:HTH domain-containing protein [Streptomyces sp. ODS25]
MLTVGVIGPEDVVQKVLAVGSGSATTRLTALPYRHEDDALDVVREARSGADALLFTGVVPHALAAAEGLLDRPAMYVPYSGATLLRALVELLRLGHDVSRISIDTLERREVTETLTEAKLPTEHVHVLPYRPGLTCQDLVDFHLAARDRKHTRVAITCLGSAFHVLDSTMHAVRLAPSRHSIRDTLQALVLAASAAHSGDAQVALGILDVPAQDAELAADLALLGGSLAHLPDGRRLVVTTRGVLEKASERFTRLPLLDALAARHPNAHVGFGLGRTAAEAESLARRAVNRARSVGAVAGVVSMQDDVDIVIDAGAGGAGQEASELSGPESLALLARRVGLHTQTLSRLRELVEAHPGEGLTAQAVADHLAVQQRTARRVLKRLERAGVAVPVGSERGEPVGRPRTVYRVLI